MRVKRAAAWLILAAAVPVIADVSADPYSGRGLVRSWGHGAVAVVLAAVVAWAAAELGAEDRAEPVGRLAERDAAP